MTSDFASSPCLWQLIGTHNGTFHCDEALAVYLLRQTPAYQNADLTRTRDPKVLDACDIVVDVGAVYDPEKLRFDHHQRGFEHSFENGFGTKLSSAGLIYKYAHCPFLLEISELMTKPRHYGKEIISGRLGLAPEDPKVQILWLKMYKEFIEAIDGIDNGVQQYPADISPKYRSRTDLSSRVGWLNPAWNQSVDPKTVDTQFEKASNLTGEEFIGRLDYYANAWLPARDIVKEGLHARATVDTSGHIILFEQFCPWKEHLFELEQELAIAENQKPFYIIYPDETAGNWRIQAVPQSPDSFISRKALPEPWRGVRDEELSKVTGVPGGIFVHASGFIGGNQTMAGALQMARLALQM
ncbi:hypothetical protein FRB98_004119 [Tulasnella sp. 332]|nr:hypothetical protein FRB98_004119 [Tulasnella sp. 332]